MYVSVFEKIQKNGNEIIRGLGQLIRDKACVKKKLAILSHCLVSHNTSLIHFSMVLALLIVGHSEKAVLKKSVMRKKNLMCSGYHARLRAINPDFFPALSDVAADPRPGFDLEAELCSQVPVVSLSPKMKTIFLML
jgi:hypothetical protein